MWQSLQLSKINWGLVGDKSETFHDLFAPDNYNLFVLVICLNILFIFVTLVPFAVWSW